MTRGKSIAITLFLTLVAVVLLAPTASARVYCVDDTPGQLADNFDVDASCQHPIGTIAAALGVAQGHAGPDSVLIGPGHFTLPALSGEPGDAVEAQYLAGPDADGNQIELRGAGRDLTRLTMGSTHGSQVGFEIQAAAGSSLSDFALTIPANADNWEVTGIFLAGALAVHDVRIDGAAASSTTGLFTEFGTPILSRIEVDLPTAPLLGNLALEAFQALPAFTDSRLRAAVGISSGNSGNVIALQRTTIEAVVGAKIEGGMIDLRDSLIDLGHRAGAIGVELACDSCGAAKSALLEGTTIVGDGPGSVGIRAEAKDYAEEAVATLASTVVEGPKTAIQVWADDGEVARVTASHSNLRAPVEMITNLDGTGEAGSATYLPSEVTALAPGFVDAAGGNYHLAPGSPLIDAGDPAAPAAGELDLDGDPRALAGACPAGAGRRDIGADEFVPTCDPVPPGGTGSAGPGLPETTIRGRHKLRTAGKSARAVLALGSSEPGAGFRCSVDGRPFKPCAAAFSVRLKRGRHSIRAQAHGVAGADPTPARFALRILRAKHGRARGGHNR